MLPVPNKACYPPEYRDKSRLHYYATLFNSIEVNSSFYKIPMAATVRKWATEVSPDFRFTFKLWRGITHNKGLDFNPADVERFMRVISHADAHKGCLLVQFPPSLKAGNLPQLGQLLRIIRLNDPDQQWQVAVEFRDRSWYSEAMYDLLQQYGASLVIHDLPASSSPMLTTAGFVYLRFHGPNGGYRGSYAESFLAEYAQYVTEWQEEGKTVYVYFNNTMGDAVQNLITLRQFIAPEAW